MKYALIIALLVAVSCSSPTAPTPTPIVVTPPVVVVPPVVLPPPVNPVTALLADPRFSLSFYRTFALGGGARPLRRPEGPPNVYIYTDDDTRAPIDAASLDAVAAAMINWTGPLTGGTFGLAGLQRGTGPAPLLPNMITVFWSAEIINACGETSGRAITLYYKVAGCGCDGLAMRLRTVKHELGHALGFTHTFDATDLMSGLSDSRCDQNPSEREVYHARVAYLMPVGSFDP